MTIEEESNKLFEQIPKAEAVRKRLGVLRSEARKLRALLKTADAIEREEQKKREEQCSQ